MRRIDDPVYKYEGGRVYGRMFELTHVVETRIRASLNIVRCGIADRLLAIRSVQRRSRRCDALAGNHSRWTYH